MCLAREHLCPALLLMPYRHLCAVLLLLKPPTPSVTKAAPIRNHPRHPAVRPHQTDQCGLILRAARV